jgi:DNA-binding NarL/FixJ family response regulator
VAAAFSNAAIAASLRISEEKGENTTQSIYNKLGRSQDRNPRVNAAVRWLQERPPSSHRRWHRQRQSPGGAT